MKLVFRNFLWYLGLSWFLVLSFIGVEYFLPEWAFGINLGLDDWIALLGGGLPLLLLFFGLGVLITFCVAVATARKSLVVSWIVFIPLLVAVHYVAIVAAMAITFRGVEVGLAGLVIYLGSLLLAVPSLLVALFAGGGLIVEQHRSKDIAVESHTSVWLLIFVFCSVVGWIALTQYIYRQEMAESVARKQQVEDSFAIQKKIVASLSDYYIKNETLPENINEIPGNPDFISYITSYKSSHDKSSNGFAEIRLHGLPITYMTVTCYTGRGRSQPPKGCYSP